MRGGSKHRRRFQAVETAAAVTQPTLAGPPADVHGNRVDGPLGERSARRHAERAELRALSRRYRASYWFTIGSG